MSREAIEWRKRIIVLIVTVLAALALREWAQVLGLSRWIVTATAPLIYLFAFYLADLMWKPWTK